MRVHNHLHFARNVSYKQYKSILTYDFNSAMSPSSRAKQYTRWFHYWCQTSTQ